MEGRTHLNVFPWCSCLAKLMQKQSKQCWFHRMLLSRDAAGRKGLFITWCPLTNHLVVPAPCESVQARRKGILTVMGLNEWITGAGERSTDRAGGGCVCIYRYIYIYIACLPHLCSFPVWIQIHLNFHIAMSLYHRPRNTAYVITSIPSSKQFQ